jgi:hypothetical protein
MPIKVRKPEKQKTVRKVRQAKIPADLSYMTNTEFGREMLQLAHEIVEEQGTRTTEEINQLIDLMRGSKAHADLPR